MVQTHRGTFGAIAALVIGLVLLTPAGSVGRSSGADSRQASLPQQGAGPSPAPPTPLAVFAHLEHCWHLGLADSLILHLAPDEVRLSFWRMGPRDGAFDPSQAGYLLRDLFRFAPTDSFRFTAYEHDPSGDDLPRAVGHWFYQGTGGADREARVEIELTAHERGWLIRSIETERW